MKPQLEHQGANIVLRGSFNPPIFHPSWFAAQGLIRRQEAEAAELQVVIPNAAIFQTEWLQIHVVQDRFQVGTTQEPYYEALRDLVIGTFELLRHAPLRVLGINRDFYYRLTSEEEWHAVGHRLAPKRDWEDVLTDPGMASLTMQGRRPDNVNGYIRVKVEPSNRVPFGIYVNVNDHYQPSSASDPSRGANEIIGILSEQWQVSMQRSLEIAERIVSVGGLR